MMRRSRRILFTVIAFAFLVLFFVFFANLSKRGLDNDQLHFDEGWSVTYGGSTSNNVNIAEYKIPEDVKIGDTLVYKKLLNIDVLPLSTLRFRTFHSAVSVYLDDQPIYSYGHDLYKQGRLVGSGFHFINLPENVDRRTITIKQIVAETAAALTSTSVKVLHNNIVSDFFSRHALAAGSGIFLCLFSVLSVFVGFIALAYSRSFYRLILIGFISFLMGLWTMCYMRVIQMFSMDFAFNTLLEYISLYLVPIPMCLLLINMRWGRLARWKMNGLWAFLAVAVLFFVVSTVSHALNFAHYSCFLPFFHLFVIVLFLYMLFARILHDRMFGMQERILVYGIVIFFSFGIIDLVRFHMQWYLGVVDSNIDVTLLPLGALVFVIFLMVSYFIYLYDVVIEMHFVTPDNDGMKCESNFTP